MKRRTILFLIFIAGFAALLAGIVWFLLARAPKVPTKTFGVTFSKMQAEALGLDWREAYESIFDDLNIKDVRIPVYWQEVEKNEGDFDFSSLDFMTLKAASHDGRVILAVGKRVPRWPECHEPEWVQSQISNLKSQKLFEYIKKTVERYKDNPTVWAWQVENEPFLNFGECPSLDVSFLDEEIALVRSLTDKPIIVTDSGEFGTWFRAYKRGDIFGTTMYRNVHNKVFGQITYPLPPSYFRLKKALVGLIYGEKPSVVIELQAEAWGPKQIYEVSTEENYKSFNPEEFRKILEYTKGTGFDTFYFWGVEWWYWLKEKQNMPEMWNMAKNAIKDIKN